jgi:hypothetical protein
MSQTIRRVFVFALALALSGFLGAQVPSQPQKIGTAFVPDLGDIVENLSALYFGGEWDMLQAKLNGILPGKKIQCHTIDPKKHFYFIVFVSQSISEDSKLIRIPWRDPAPEPYAMRVPGEKEVFEIVLGAGSNLTLESVYSSSELENPLLAQIPALVKTIEPALFALAPEAGLRTGKEPSMQLPPNVELRSIVLPFQRAKIGIKDKAVLSGNALTSTVKKKAVELNNSIKMRVAYLNELSQNLSDSIEESISAVIPPGPDVEPSDTLAKAVRAAYLNHIEENPKLTKDELNLAIGIEKEYVALIDALAEKKVEAESSYENNPLAHVSFGLIIPSPKKGPSSRMTDSSRPIRPVCP